MLRLVRRDFLITYQQTILGPLWIVFHPVITLIAYLLIFEKAVGLSTDGIHPVLFYLSGIILWSLFSESFTGTAFTFTQNRDLFDKVYFPRLVVPLAVVMGNLVRFAVQFVIFFAFLIWLEPAVVVDHPLRWLCVFLFTVTLVAAFGLGLGLIFSIITARYRDLVNVIQLIVRLLMFATPVIYPMSAIDASMRKWAYVNPLSGVIELFRFGFSGHGLFSASDILYSACATILVVGGGVILFTKYSKRLQDVI